MGDPLLVVENFEELFDYTEEVRFSTGNRNQYDNHFLVKKVPF